MIESKHWLYTRLIKRVLDFFIAVISVIILSPLLLTLTIVGAVAMRGNPFFVQPRPGMKGTDGKEKIFNLIKFRTMSNEKDENGNLLPDDVRLNKYGRFLRKTSLDELGELINIINGDIAFVGPRPLLTEYLPYYTEQEHHRHDVRPGLTGWAQINGRNNIRSWEERFEYDLEYVRRCSLFFDIKILFLTVLKVVKSSDILVGSEIKVGRLDDARRKESVNGNTQEI